MAKSAADLGNALCSVGVSERASAQVAEGDDDALFDPSAPFRGIVVCCTSIPPEQRTDIANKTAELGGVHKYDLTPDVTHLIVGEYDTPKYRHVAKDRPDIRPMAAEWVEAVRDLWVADAEITFAALEDQYTLRTFETCGVVTALDASNAPKGDRGRVLCCLTGFDDATERQRIVESITTNGGLYTGDLTRNKVTHLIAFKPQGKKFAAAKEWGIYTVGLEWLRDSIARGMILEERLYDASLPPEQRGQGAWNKRECTRTTLGKRLRDGAAAAQEESRRKLRRTTSLKLGSQRDNLWGDILGKPASADQSGSRLDVPTQIIESEPGAQSISLSVKTGERQRTQPSLPGLTGGAGIFDNCCFFIHGFSKAKADILINTIIFLGGSTSSTLEETAQYSPPDNTAYRFLIVPQDSQPDTHPTLPAGVHIVTEFFIEKCLHRKCFFEPDEHVIGRPFPQFPVAGFEKLTVCTAGFTGVDLNQVDRTIRQLGARYEERFTSDVSVLVCSTLTAVRKQKLDLALMWKIPVVSAEWLWDCVSTGFHVPIDAFLFPELKQRVVRERKPTPTSASSETDANGLRAGPTGDITEPRQQPRAGVRNVDGSAFEKASLEMPEEAARTTSKQASAVAADCEIAPAHLPLGGRSSSKTSAPLSEASDATTNARSSRHSSQARDQPSRQPMRRVVSEVADSETAEDDAYGLEEAIAIQDENVVLMKPRWDEEIEAKRQQQEKAEKAAAERMSLSSRLVALLDTEPRSIVTGDSNTSRDSDPVSKPTRRKREILGRAISNVSAASSGSVDSAGCAVNAGRVASFSTGLQCPTDDAQKLPPATQLGYEDDETRYHRERLFKKMLGTASSSPDPAKAGHAASERLTLADLAAPPAGGVTTRATRTRRR